MRGLLDFPLTIVFSRSNSTDDQLHEHFSDWLRWVQFVNQRSLSPKCYAELDRYKKIQPFSVTHFDLPRHSSTPSKTNVFQVISRNCKFSSPLPQPFPGTLSQIFPASYLSFINADWTSQSEGISEGRRGFLFVPQS